jgi:diguanylate cyclase (GGDEF)-like protein
VLHGNIAKVAIRRFSIGRTAAAWSPLIIGGIALVWLIPATAFPSVSLMAVYTVMAVLGGSRIYAFAEGGYQTLIAAMLLPAIVLLGPLPGALIGMVGVSIYQLVVRRQPLEVAAHSIGQRTVSALAAGLAWSVLATGSPAMNRPVYVAQPDTLLTAVPGTLLVYALVSAFQVSVRHALRRHVPLSSVLRANAIWDLMGTVLVGACGLAIALPISGVSPRATLESVLPVLLTSLVLLSLMFQRQVINESAELRDAIADLLQTPDLDELLARLANRASRIGRPDLLWIVLHRNGAGPKVAVARGLDPTLVQRLCTEPGGRGLGWILAVQDTECIDDFRNHARWSWEIDEVHGRGRVRSLMIAPLGLRGELLGTLVVTKPIPHYFTSVQQQSIAALAAQAALIMRNASLFAQVSQASDELRALSDSAQALNRSLELSIVLDGLVSVTCQRFGYDRGMISLVDGTDGALVVRAVAGDPQPVGRRIAKGHGAEGRAVAEARPVLVRAAAAEPGAASPIRPGSTLAVPLIRDQRVIGVYSVGVHPPGELTQRDERILTTLAGYAAVAIENASLYEQTRDLATTDGLTGLLNHRALWQGLEAELKRAKRHALSLALIIVEIDHFKRYNDTYGHLRGDEVLRLVALTLKQQHRQQIDMIYRYGGDEFVLLLPHTTQPAAVLVAERIREAIESTSLIVDEGTATLTASLGLASFPEDGDTANDLVNAADGRMYAAKRAGGNAVGSVQAQIAYPGLSEIL